MALQWFLACLLAGKGLNPMVGFNLSFKLNGWAQHNGWVQLLIE